MGRPEYKPDEIKALTCIAKGLGCPEDVRYVLPHLAVTGEVRLYDGPPMEGMTGSYLMTFFGREMAGDLMGQVWKDGALVEPEKVRAQ